MKKHFSPWSTSESGETFKFDSGSKIALPLFSNYQLFIFTVVSLRENRMFETEYHYINCCQYFEEELDFNKCDRDSSHSFPRSLHSIRLISVTYMPILIKGIRRLRLTMGSILVVCLAGAPASVAAEADAGVTVFVTEATSVLCLRSVEAVALFSADPSLRGGLCQLLLT